MTNSSPSEPSTTRPEPPALAIGAILVLIGLGLFAAQLLDFRLDQIG